MAWSCAFAVATALLQLCAASRMERTELRMPGGQPEQAETYLCTSMSLDPNKEHYITEFEPHASMKHAHHLLLFGCTEPGQADSSENGPIWNCGEMHAAHGAPESTNYEHAPVCAQGSTILYAWGRDAPALKLPKGVGFRVGGETPVQYLVLQLHYMHPITEGESDNSGVTLISTTEPMPNSAATMLLVTDGQINAKSTENFETACVIDEPVQMHPFAFRVHAHEHGKVVSGWKVSKDDKGADKWSLIGKQDPMQPQMFYPVKDDKLVINPGDVVAARCHMVNDEDRDIPIGATGADEMCNFYMMYWVEGDQILQDNNCLSPGPPDYYWAKEGGLTNVPDKEANQL